MVAQIYLHSEKAACLVSFFNALMQRKSGNFLNAFQGFKMFVNYFKVSREDI